MKSRSPADPGAAAPKKKRGAQCKPSVNQKAAIRLIAATWMPLEDVRTGKKESITMRAAEKEMIVRTLYELDANRGVAPKETVVRKLLLEAAKNIHAAAAAEEAAAAAAAAAPPAGRTRNATATAHQAVPPPPPAGRRRTSPKLIWLTSKTK
jgi:predicted HicB family RNase H-like nuclease